MADELKQGEAAEPKAPVSPTGEGAPAPRTYTDADIAKARRKAEQRAEAAEAELAKLREQSKTEAEKALEEAYKRGKSETEAQYQARLNEERIDGAIRRKLLELSSATGIDEDQVHVIRAKHPDIETVEDAIAKATEYAEAWKEKHPAARPVVPGQPGGPTAPPPQTDWTGGAIRSASKADFARDWAAGTIQSQLAKKLNG